EGTIYRVDAKLTMSRLIGRDMLRELLRLEVKEQDAVADACGVVGLGNLECHEAAIGGDDWIGSFPACIVVEIRKASEVLSGSVEFYFPDVDISGAAGTAKLLALTVRFDGGIQTVREDTLDLIVRARCFGEIRHHASAQVDAHDRGLTTRLIAGERHFVIVVVEILRFESAAMVLAFIYDLF